MRIVPYLSGEDINDTPNQIPCRQIINLGEMTEEEAGEWPELLAILERKVKPERESKSEEVAGRPWWQYFRVRPERSVVSCVPPINHGQ